MPDDPLFIPEFMLYAKSSLLWFKITTELREFRNYLCILTIPVFYLSSDAILTILPYKIFYLLCLFLVADLTFTLAAVNIITRKTLYF